MILIDTNILIYSKQSSSEFFHEVTERLLAFSVNDETLVVCPQILYEFYVTATRPNAYNGLGLTIQQAIDEIQSICETYTLIEDSADLLHRWRQIILDYNVIGKQSHDARIVASMQMHGVNRMYTINTSDFARFEDIIELV